MFLYKRFTLNYSFIKIGYVHSPIADIIFYSTFGIKFLVFQPLIEIFKKKKRDAGYK